MKAFLGITSAYNNESLNNLYYLGNKAKQAIGRLGLIMPV